MKGEDHSTNINHGTSANSLKWPEEFQKGEEKSGNSIDNKLIFKKTIHIVF